MDGILDIIERRRAYRALSDREIEAETVQRIMKAATLAPSCFNSQPWRFIAVSGATARTMVREALSEGNYWAYHAPLFVIVATKPELDCQLKGGRDYALFDTGQAVMSLQYQAVHEGLIAHPIAGFSPSKLKSFFDIPDDYVLITIVVVGYPGDDSALNEKHLELEHSPRSRKPIESVVSLDGWEFGEEATG